MSRRGWPISLLGLALFLGFIVAVPLLLAPDDECDPGLAGTGTLAGSQRTGKFDDEQLANAKATSGSGRGRSVRLNRLVRK